jgi:general secretion pathway protein M
MINQVRQWWLGLARRERVLVAGAASVVVTALVYLLAVEPAWLMRTRALQSLPRLQEQLSELEALREEVRLLRQQGFGTQSAEALRNAAQSSLERTGLTAAIQLEGRRLVLRASAVAAAAWFNWMERFSREARVRVVQARVTRARPEGGLVDAEVSLEVPER